MADESTHGARLGGVSQAHARATSGATVGDPFRRVAVDNRIEQT